VADNILAAKARKRITARDSTLGVRVAATVVWAAIKAKTKIGMGLKIKKKKATSKRIFSVAKRGDVLPQFYRCWELSVCWLVERRKLQRRWMITKPCNVSWKNWNVTIVSWKVAEFILFRTRMVEVSRKKKIQRNTKNTKGYNYHSTATIGKPHAHSIF